MINGRRFYKSFHYALEGVHYALTHDQNLVIHFLVACLVIVASIFLDVNPFEMGILGVTILLVISLFGDTVIHRSTLAIRIFFTKDYTIMFVILTILTSQIALWHSDPAAF